MDTGSHIHNQQAKTSLKVSMRWLIRRDMLEVLEIERACFECPWEEEEFLSCLRQRNCIGTVAEYNRRIAAFMIYELHKTRIQVLNFAVAPDLHRMGIGSQMVQRIVAKLSHQRRTETIFEVRETDLPAQLFLRSQGFRAIQTLRNYFPESNEDMYLMSYRLPEARGPAIPNFA